MTDKTLGAYKRTTPDPYETAGEALARLQAEMTRLLDEADVELRDEADGGVAAALIEQEAENPDPSVDYHAMWWKAEREREKAERERDEARATKDMHKRRADEERARAEKAEQERDHWKREADGANADLADLRAAKSRPLTPDAISADAYERGVPVLRDACPHGFKLSIPAYEAVRAIVAAVLTEPPARPEWLDAPAVRAWHKRDGRTEHDGTPGKPRIWSPDYGRTETWSTPSLREVPWTDLVDVEPLDVSAELAEGLDRVAEFMRTGGVRLAPEDGAA